MTSPVSSLVAAGTGRQGGAVNNAFSADEISPVLPRHIYANARNPNGFAASGFAARGISLVPGVLSNPDPTFEHLQSHWGELNDACRFTDATVPYGLQYVVYSSVDRGGKELSDRHASYCKTDKFHIGITSQRRSVRIVLKNM